MTYTEQKIKINGAWRWVLVVSSTEPITLEDPKKIVHGNTTYLTEGLYREAEDNGNYYCWFVIDRIEVTSTDKMAEYEEALRILGVETEEADEA